MLVSHRPAPTSAEDHNELRSELSRTLEWLCRSCPEEVRAEAAHEELVEVSPRVQVAIEAIEDIKRRRRLTEDELAWRRTLTLLLNAGR
jgi:hypothetical protein